MKRVTEHYNEICRYRLLNAIHFLCKSVHLWYAAIEVKCSFFNCIRKYYSFIAPTSNESWKPIGISPCAWFALVADNCSVLFEDKWPWRHCPPGDLRPLWRTDVRTSQVPDCPVRHLMYTEVLRTYRYNIMSDFE